MRTANENQIENRMNAQELFTLIKTKYPESGLSDKEVMGIASSLYATGLVTDENAQKIVDAQSDSIKSMQSLFDQRFSSQKDAFKNALTGQLEKSFKDKYHIVEDGKQVIDDPNHKPAQDDAAAIMAKLLDEKLKPLSDKIAAREAKEAAEVRTAQNIATGKAYGIPENLVRMMNVPENATADFWKDAAQTFKNEGLQEPQAPQNGDHGKDDGKALAEIIKAGAPKPKE